MLASTFLHIIPLCCLLFYPVHALECFERDVSRRYAFLNACSDLINSFKNRRDYDQPKEYSYRKRQGIITLPLPFDQPGCQLTLSWKDMRRPRMFPYDIASYRNIAGAGSAILIACPWHSVESWEVGRGGSVTTGVWEHLLLELTAGPTGNVSTSVADLQSESNATIQEGETSSA